MKNLISIIIPAHNSEKTIERCLLSVKKQTYQKFECLIIDDASSDSTLSKIKAFISDDERFKAYSLRENQGAAGARNKGLLKAKGQYITFVDADDVIHPRMLEILIDAAIDTNHSLISCKSYEKKSNDLIELNWNIGTNIESKFYNLDSNFNYDQNASVTCWGSLYKLDILEGIKFDESLSVGEDSLFWAQTLVNAQGVEKIEAPLYCYVEYSESALHGELNEKRFSEIIAWEQIRDYFQESIPNLFRDNFRATFFSAYSFRLRQKYESDKTGKFRKTIYSKARKCLGEIVHSSLSRKQKMSALLFVVSPMVWTKIKKS